MNLIHIGILFIAAYLMGAVPFAYLIGRLNGIDIFTIGSGNMGATNIARSLGYFWGVVTMFLDSAKGVMAILILRELAPENHRLLVTMVGAVGAVLGHMWSVFVWMITGQFRGGKGAATATGTWFMFLPMLFIVVVMALAVVVLAFTRYMSLTVLISNTIISVVVVSLVLLNGYDPLYLIYLPICAVIFYRHRENIKSLLNGTERHFGERVG